MQMSNVAKDQTFEDQMNYFENARVENELDTVWSIYEVNDINAKCAIKVANKRVVYESFLPNATTEDIMADLKDGGKRSSAQYSAFVGGDTWVDLWKAANSVIKQSGTHHKYIEDFTMNDDGELELTTGS
jgi:hypothetical protein